MCRLLFLLAVSSVFFSCQQNANRKDTSRTWQNPGPSKIWLGEGTQAFRDLNHNGVMDVYEDVNEEINNRVEDLLGQLSLEEKAGLLFINGAPVSEDGDPWKKGAGHAARLETVPIAMDSLKMNHFNIWSIPRDPAMLAKWHNQVQMHAEKSRLGIPVTIASDPRHHLGKNVIGMDATGFTQFCEMTGFAALRDSKAVFDFAEVVRTEYLAVGIRMALHPQIDLATEPRWARISGNFSEDADLTARLVRPYINALQGTELSTGVACMTKHFPGGGPQNEGLDPHFSFQKGQIYPGDNFDYHLIPFEAAFESKTAAIMPYYGIPVGQTDEDVAMSYNKTIITSLLREHYQYDGVVCTDWGLITDRTMGPDIIWKARAWGVEHLSELERVEKMLNAGVDQFGGESRPELVIELVENKSISENRLDQSIRRLLRLKFELGLFDNPFVDETAVKNKLQSKEATELGKQIQKESITLLKNSDNTLPLQKNSLKVYIENLDSATIADYATVVTNPKEANLAIIRLNTPWYPAETNNPFAQTFHHGDLDFKGDEKSKIIDLLKEVPTVVDIYLDRPAVIPEIADHADCLLANYGSSDLALCEVLFGEGQPKGKLPFELPSSMNAVRVQKADLPYDSHQPLFEFGYGLSYD